MISAESTAREINSITIQYRFIAKEGDNGMKRLLRSLLAILVCFALCIPALLNPVHADEENQNVPEEESTAEPVSEEDQGEPPVIEVVEGDPETDEESAVVEVNEETTDTIKESNDFNPEVITDLQEDECYYGDLNSGEIQWLSFTPAVSDSYDFEMDLMPNVTVTLYDQNGAELESVYLTEYGYTLTTELSEGNKYYLKLANSYYSSGGYNVKAARTPFITAEPVGDTDIEAEYGSPVRLEVAASSRLGTELTYSWSSSQWSLLPEVTDTNVLEIEAITTSASFWCYISDEYGNYTEVGFWVKTNRFSVTADVPTNQYVLPGSSAELRVVASGDDLSKVEYSWHVGEWNEEYEWYDNFHQIEGEDQSVYLTDGIQEKKQYICEVNDGYGNYSSVPFYINTADSVQTLSLNESKTVTFEGKGEEHAFTIIVPDNNYYIIQGTATGESNMQLYIRDYFDSRSFGQYNDYTETIVKDSLKDNQCTLVVRGEEPGFNGTITVKLLTPITVTFDAGSQGYFLDGNDEKQQTRKIYVTPEDSVYGEWPEIYEDNVEFDGWYIDPELTERFETGSNTHVTEDLTVYAKYQVCKKLTLHAGEGNTFGDGEETYIHLFNEGISLSYIFYPQVPGKAVKEWYDNPELSGDPINENTRITEDLEVYAKWVPSVKVTLNAGDGYFDEYDGNFERIYSVEDAEGKSVYLRTPQHKSKIFEGWYTSPDFSPGTRVETTNDTIVLSESTTYYAKYETGVKVTYNANGGSFVDYFEPQVLLKKGSYFRNYSSGVVTHSNQNKIFNGWSLTKDGKQKINGEYTVTKDITVYAVWADAVYVKFVAPGVEFYNGETNETTLKTPKGELLSFYGRMARALDPDKYIEGWYTDPQFKNKVDFGTYKFTKNMTLYGNVKQRPEYKDFRISIGYVEPQMQYMIDAEEGETNYIYYPKDSYVFFYVHPEPAEAYLKDIGSTEIISGTSAEFYSKHCGNDTDYAENPEKSTWAQYTYHTVNTGTTTVELTVDGKKTTFVITVPDKLFKDVNKPTQYYYNAVYWAVGKGITQGMGPDTFNPGGFCKRYQFVLFLWRQAGCPEPTETEDPFTDVLNDPNKNVYEKAVLWAKEKNITTGTTPTTFAPYAPLTRGQVVTFLYRAAGEPEVKTTKNPFRDLDSSKYYYTPVLWAVENEITTGLNATQFGPVNTCTRGQTVLFMYRLFKDQQTVAESNH